MAKLDQTKFSKAKLSNWNDIQARFWRNICCYMNWNCLKNLCSIHGHDLHGTAFRLSFRLDWSRWSDAKNKMVEITKSCKFSTCETELVYKKDCIIYSDLSEGSCLYPCFNYSTIGCKKKIIQGIEVTQKFNKKCVCKLTVANPFRFAKFGIAIKILQMTMTSILWQLHWCQQLLFWLQ